MNLMMCNYTNSREPEFSDHTGNKGPAIDSVCQHRVHGNYLDGPLSTECHLLYWHVVNPRLIEQVVWSTSPDSVSLEIHTHCSCEARTKLTLEKKNACIYPVHAFNKMILCIAFPSNNLYFCKCINKFLGFYTFAVKLNMLKLY